MPNDILVNRFSTEIFVLFCSFEMFKHIWLFDLVPSSLNIFLELILVFLLITSLLLITSDWFDWPDTTDTLSTFSTIRVFLALTFFTKSWIVAELSVMSFVASLSSSFIVVTIDWLLQRHCWFSVDRILYLEVGTVRRGRSISTCKAYALYNVLLVNKF